MERPKFFVSRICGLCQSSWATWKYLTDKLGNFGLPQAPFDPCLFIGKKVIVIWWSDFLGLSVQLCAKGVDLEQKDAAAGFLRVHIKRDPETGFLKMMQKGLTKRVLKTLGLNVGTTNGKFISAKGKPLVKHVHGEPASGDFNCSSVIEMLLYLASDTHPAITYNVNCAARFMYCQKLVHKYVLKQIGCYLKATSVTGLIMKPSEKLLKIDSFPEANFAGIYRDEAMDDIVFWSKTWYE